jgi:hypothetical protein
MRQLVISIIVLAVALILSVIFIPFGLVYGLTYRILYKRDFSYLSHILMEISVCIDKMDNIICGDFLNHVLVKTGTPFGRRNETVSKKIAENRGGNLTKLGINIGIILEKIDSGHLDSALKENIL